ncbi:hypothetical protein D3C71_1126040 [compost metagenome]
MEQRTSTTEQHLRAGRGQWRPGARRCGAVDAAGAGRPGADAGHPHRAVGGGARCAFFTDRTKRRSHRPARARPQRACRTARPGARPLVPLPLHAGQCRQRHGAHAHRASARRLARHAAAGLCLVPALGTWPLRRLAPSGGRPARPGAVSGRLHLRIRDAEKHHRPGAHPQPAPRHHAGGFSRPLRPAQKRPRPASRPRCLPLGRDLGRPRGAERLRQWRRPGRRRQLSDIARRGLAGVLRKHAPARRQSDPARL